VLWGPRGRTACCCRADRCTATLRRCSALGDVLEEGEEGEEAVQQGRVLFGFAAEAEGELSVSPGDYVVVEAEIDGWLQVRALDPTRGPCQATLARSHAWLASIACASFPAACVCRAPCAGVPARGRGARPGARKLRGAHGLRAERWGGQGTRGCRWEQSDEAE
jgi:hypothetical protein